MKQCELNPSTLSSHSQGRSSWRTLCYEAVEQFEKSRVEALEHKLAVRKFGAQPSSNLGVWPRDSCSRICSSRIGLYTHQRTHRWQSIRHIDGAVQDADVTYFTYALSLLVEHSPQTTCFHPALSWAVASIFLQLYSAWNQPSPFHSSDLFSSSCSSAIIVMDFHKVFFLLHSRRVWHGSDLTTRPNPTHGYGYAYRPLCLLWGVIPTCTATTSELVSIGSTL